MAKLPALSGKQLINALKKAGFEEIRQKESHVSLRKGQHKTVVPLHGDLAKGTLHDILKQCGISKDELIRLLNI